MPVAASILCPMNNPQPIISAEARRLPAYAISEAVNRSLAAQPCLVVTAPPGAGKSTVLPLTILQGLGPDGRIIMLEPRRLAARAVAERMAELLGEPVGQTVGYRVRFEKKVTAATRIEVVTEGILTRMLIDDPTLDGVAAVIFDEFHERSIHSDVALALVREAHDVLRPDLRIVIMSATIDATAICTALTTPDGRPAPLIESDGRMFPVEVHHADTTATPDDCAARVASAVRQALECHEGDILAFLPGEGEIRRCEELLQGASATVDVRPLYGMLSLAQQRQAILPSADGRRRIVLATNIAETSLTIEGIRIVVDSGLCRQMTYDSGSGLGRLDTVPISLDMAQQRTGRAGRLTEGVCYRLWTMATEHRMAPQRTAELLTADLAPMLLDVAAWGESRVERLPWLTPPPASAVAQARRLLTALGALTPNGSITPHGRRLAQLPCHPRIAQMLIDRKRQALAADVAALLEERDILGSDAPDANLCTRLEAYRRQPSRYRRIARIAEQYRRMTHTDEDLQPTSPYDVGALIAMAYPERVAKAHPDGCGRFTTASGDVVRVEQSDIIASYDWVAVANYSSASGRIFLAAPLDPADLTPLIYIKDNIAWDAKAGTILARREKRVGGLVVSAQPLTDVPREQLVGVICAAARRRGESMLNFAADAVLALQTRVATLAAWHPELSLPDLSTAAVLERVEEWLPLYIDRPTADLRRIDLAEALLSLLSYDQQQALDRLTPTHITVPTGSRIRLEYRPAAESPVLRVRLQECFGMTDTPRIDDGRQPVLLELLSPGFKPVQLTRDLRSFWTQAYFDVRKELRRRYPKHHWPDNPLEAEPVRGVKRKN